MKERARGRGEAGAGAGGEKAADGQRREGCASPRGEVRAAAEKQNKRTRENEVACTTHTCVHGVEIGVIRK